MSLNYAHEKLSTAVLSLAQSTESLQDRLAAVYSGGLMLIGLELQADLPEDLQAAYRSITERLTGAGVVVEGEGKIAPTIRTMSDSEAQRVISDIVVLSSEVALRLGAHYQKGA